MAKDDAMCFAHIEARVHHLFMDDPNDEYANRTDLDYEYSGIASNKHGGIQLLWCGKIKAIIFDEW